MSVTLTPACCVVDGCGTGLAGANATRRRGCRPPTFKVFVDGLLCRCNVPIQGPRWKRTSCMSPEPPDENHHASGVPDFAAEPRGPSVAAALARLIGGDPLAADLVRSAAAAHADRVEIHAALALCSNDPTPALAQARALARTRRERQHVAIIAEHLSGAVDRTRLLSRQHLAEFPDDVVISWLIGRG